MSGIEWYINSIWHYPSEKPAPERMILVLFESGNLTSWYSAHSINTFLKMHKVSKWAYVDDLIIKDLI